MPSDNSTGLRPGSRGPCLPCTVRSSESHTQDQTRHAHVSIQAETGGGTQGPTHRCRTSRRTGTTAPRPGFQLRWAAPALGTGADGEPKEHSLAQLEHGAQFPGTWRGQGQDHTAVCALLTSGAPSSLAHWCPYLPHPRGPPRAWPTANSRPPSSPTLPLELGRDSSEMERRRCRGHRLERAEGGQGHAGPIQRPPLRGSPETPSSLYTKSAGTPWALGAPAPRRLPACSDPRS